MCDKGKSVLDGVKVENKAFPQDPDYTGPAVGNVGAIVCPHCGKGIVITGVVKSAKIQDLAQTK